MPSPLTCFLDKNKNKVLNLFARMWCMALNPLFVDVRLIASPSTLLYFDMDPSAENLRTRLFKHLLTLLNLNLSDLVS